MREGLEVAIVVLFVYPIGDVLGIVAAIVPIVLDVRILVSNIDAIVCVPMVLPIEGIVATQGSNAAIAYHVFLLHSLVSNLVPRRDRIVRLHSRLLRVRNYPNSYMVASN